MMNRVWIPVLLLSLVSFRSAEGGLCKISNVMAICVKMCPSEFLCSLISNKQIPRGPELPLLRHQGPVHAALRQPGGQLHHLPAQLHEV